MNNQYDALYDDDVSTAGAVETKVKLPTFQWHIGVPQLTDGSFNNLGGWFLPEDSILQLGLNLDEPVKGAESTALRLGGKVVKGWGFDTLTIAVLKAQITFEERNPEPGKRPNVLPQGAKDIDFTQYKGRTRIIAGVKELIDAGATGFPVMLTSHGKAGQAMGFEKYNSQKGVQNGLLSDVYELAQVVTNLRKAQNKSEVGPSAFWTTVVTSEIKKVYKQGSKTEGSDMALPTFVRAPENPNRDYLLTRFNTKKDLTGQGGLFEIWLNTYGDLLERNDEPDERALTNTQTEAVNAIRAWVVSDAESILKKGGGHVSGSATAEQKFELIESICIGFRLSKWDASQLALNLLNLCFAIQQGDTPNLAQILSLQNFITNYPYAREYVATWQANRQ